MSVHNYDVRDPNGQPSPVGLTNLGAFFAIQVHVPPQIAQMLTASNQPIPDPISGLALVDTGATLTCIDVNILQRLGLNPVGIVNSGTANGPAQQHTYPARIVFPAQNWTLDVGEAVGVNLSGQTVALPQPAPIIALLGRTFLVRTVFIYNGTMGRWTLTM